MKNKLLKSILKTIFILVVFYIITYYINSNITIRGLYKDDLASWSWFPGLNFYDFAIKFYDTATRYRPVFYALEYIEYFIVGNHVKWFTCINVFLNSIIATFVYKFAKKNSKSTIVAFIISLCYIISHFSYYQITQVIGILETYSQLFALIILYLCISYIDNDNYSLPKLSFIYIVYFLASFTHERYMFLAVPIIFTIIAKCLLKNSQHISNNKYKNNQFKNTILHLIIFTLEITSIVYIRILSTGKFIPSGTGGTEVNETFNIVEAFTFAINQVLFIFGIKSFDVEYKFVFIFGINIGPEHLVGMPFETMPIYLKIILFVSILILLSIIFIYILVKANYIKNNKTQNLLDLIYQDILYIVFIMLAIGSSSVTIRVEMRFVYVSFTASMLYLSYMIGEITKYTNTNRNNIISDKNNKLVISQQH